MIAKPDSNFFIRHLVVLAALLVISFWDDSFILFIMILRFGFLRPWPNRSGGSLMSVSLNKPRSGRKWIPAAACFFLLAAAPAACRSGDLLPSLSPLTRQEAIDLALSRSDAAGIIRSTAMEERAEAVSLTAFARPRLALTAAYTEMDNDMPSPPVAQSGSPSRDISAGWQVRQLLFAGGRIPAHADLRRRREAAAGMRKTAGFRNLRAGVRRSFDGILHQRALLRIMEDRIRQRREELVDARDLKEAGVVTGLDVRQARLSLNAALGEKDDGDARLRALLLDFHVLIGEPGDTLTRLPAGELDVPSPAAPILERISAAMESRRQLDIAINRNRARQMDALDRAARAAFWPEVALAASGGISGEEADDPARAWRVGLEAQWLLYDGGRLRSGAAAASARRQAAHDALRQTEKELRADRERLRSDFESLARRIALQVKSVELARLNYDDARAQYRAGIITQVTLGLYHLNYAENRFVLQNLYFQYGNAVTEALYLAETAEQTELPKKDG